MTATITKEAALSLIPDGEFVHVFTSNMIGADWTRAEAAEFIEAAEDLRLGEGMCRALNHSLVASPVDGRPRFFQVDPDRLAAFEAVQSAA